MSGPVLIADDLVTERIALKARLAGAHHLVKQVKSRAELMALGAQDKPGAIVMDVDFDGRRGIGICREIKANPVLRDVPVVLYGTRMNGDLRLLAFEAGADECLADLPGDRFLMALLRNLMRKRATLEELNRRRALLDSAALAEPAVPFAARADVALVATDKAAGITARRDLAHACNGAIRLLSPEQILKESEAAAHAPGAVILAEDPANPNRTLQLLAELRARRATRNAVIVLKLASNGSHTGDIALDLGADAVTPPGASARELALRLEALLARKSEEDWLRMLVENQLDEALRDPLTGLFNRRYATGYLARLTRDARARKMPFSVMLLDLDHFKQVNDTYGHPAGDEVLRVLAARVLDNLREMDLAARIGGEEFLIVLQRADHALAERVAERLRDVIARTPVCLPGRGHAISVTASIGVATSAAGEDEADALMEAADRALYRAKQEGRNQVTYAEAPRRWA